MPTCSHAFFLVLIEIYILRQSTPTEKLCEKMEKKGVTLSVAIVGYLVLGLLLGQCSAVENPECYAGCLNKCKSSRGMMLLACGSACALQCLFSSPSLLSVPKDNHYFCKLGCSASLCNSFLDAENPGINIQSQFIVHQYRFHFIFQTPLAP